MGFTDLPGGPVVRTPWSRCQGPWVLLRTIDRKAPYRSEDQRLGLDTDLLPSLPFVMSVGSTLASQSPDKARHGQQRADGPVVEAGGGLPGGGASHWPPGLCPGCALAP